MRPDRVALRTFRWILLAACLLLTAGLVGILWWDIGQGREVRDTERVETVNDAPTLPPRVNPQ